MFVSTWSFLRPLKGLCSLHMILYAYHTRNFTRTKHLNVKYLNHIFNICIYLNTFYFLLLWRVTNWFVWLSDEASPTKPRPSTVCEPMRQHQTNVSGRRSSIVIPFVIVDDFHISNFIQQPVWRTQVSLFKPTLTDTVNVCEL